MQRNLRERAQCGSLCRLLVSVAVSSFSKGEERLGRLEASEGSNIAARVSSALDSSDSLDHKMLLLFAMCHSQERAQPRPNPKEENAIALIFI
jgi:hypothetical protein